jgi:hypothetical protein
LNPAFTGAPAGFPNARHSTTSPANLAAEPTLGATAPGSHGLQRMQSKYGNLEHAAANNAMHTRGESMASRYSSDPTHVSPTSASTPVGQLKFQMYDIFFQTIPNEKSGKCDMLLFSSQLELASNTSCPYSERLRGCGPGTYSTPIATPYCSPS